MSDEADFHLSGYVKKQNSDAGIHTISRGFINAFSTAKGYSVICDIFSRIGPYFFGDNVECVVTDKSETYKLRWKFS
jgi:hypothetical protein